MRVKIVRRRGQIALVIDDPRKPAWDRDVLAGMSLLEGTGCWRLVDVRLTRYHVPSPYAGSVSGEDYHASFEPESPEEAAYIKSLLREFREDEDGTINWCSFEGIVRGHPEVNGYRPVKYKDFDQAGYLSRAEGLARLEAIKEFWGAYEGDPANVRNYNPNRQPPFSEVLTRVLMWRRERVPHAKSGVRSPSM